ncbi:MAG: hypothetical protein OXE59_02755 [Bacteroidetes bacterium]|nr:hypothetical protein [Bacteroidota bacterium]
MQFNQSIRCDLNSNRQSQDLIASVAHYPSGCSKWNPIEHRLHSEVSKNCAGILLINMACLVNLIRGTTTKTGLSFTAVAVNKSYETGIKILS